MKQVFVTLEEHRETQKEIGRLRQEVRELQMNLDQANSELKKAQDKAKFWNEAWYEQREATGKVAVQEYKNGVRAARNNNVWGENPQHKDTFCHGKEK
jgi:uncharacterized protein YlxW (UPF0749 family)